MNASEPRYTPDEFARRGQELYDHIIRPTLQLDDDGKFVAIDIEFGNFELDRDGYAATEGLLIHHPEAQIWLMRVGERAAYRL